MWDDAQEEELKGRYRQEVMEALKVAESKPFASVKEMFRDVWAELTPELERQRE
ncbi:bkdA, partial [Symbiodinium sp. KB8]